MHPSLREEIAALRRDLDQLNNRLSLLEHLADSGAPQATPLLAETPTPTVIPPPPPFDTLSQNAPEPRSLESRIGSQWLNRVGIIAVLFGVAYFLKLAFENNWIGPSGRIAIGLVTGIALFVWSERFRRTGSVPFSHTLKAISIGTLYLSLWAAFHLYHLVPAGVAFGAMFIVTASTLAISLQQNAQIIAAMSHFGGLASPALVSTGENHEIFLFSYLALLSITAGVLAVQRGWWALPFSALLGTTGYYIGWSAEFYHYPYPDFGKTLFFVLLFFAIFLLTANLGRSTETGRARLLPAGLLCVNAVFSFAEIYDLFSHPDQRPFLPWMVLLLAAAYLGVSRRVASTPLRLLNIAIALALITIAIPLKLHSHFITLGWLVESAVVLYLADRFRLRLFEIGGVLALALGILRLLTFDNFYPAHPFWNMRALLFLIAIAITAVIAHFARLNPDRPHSREAWYVAAIAVTVLTLLGLDHELAFALAPNTTAPADAQRRADLTMNFTRSALWMVYGAAAMALGFLRRIPFYRYLALALLAITVCKVFVYDIVELDPGYRVVSFIALGVILLAVSYAYQKDWLKLSNTEAQ